MRRNLTSVPEILQWITGYSIPFGEKPPVQSITPSNNSFSKEEICLILEEITKIKSLYTYKTL